MANNQVVTEYDDSAIPAQASRTVSLTGTGVVKNAPGRLHKVIVSVVTATAAITIYDNAATNAGTVLLVIPAATAAGTVYDVNLPALNGIYAQFGSATGTLTFGYA